MVRLTFEPSVLVSKVGFREKTRGIIGSLVAPEASIPGAGPGDLEHHLTGV